MKKIYVITILNILVMSLYLVTSFSFIETKEFLLFALIFIVSITSIIISIIMLKHIYRRKVIKLFIINLIISGIFSIFVAILYLFLLYPILIYFAIRYYKYISNFSVQELSYSNNEEKRKKLISLYEYGIINTQTLETRLKEINDYEAN